MRVNYKVVGSKEEYTNDEKLITTSNVDRFDNKADLVLGPISCVQVLEGVVTDSKSGEVLPGANVEVTTSTGEKVVTVLSDAKGAYSIAKCRL